MKIQILVVIMILALAGLAPAATVTLNSPKNDSNLSSSIVNFNCSASSTTTLSNMTLYGDWSGSWAANQTENISGASNTSIFTESIPQGNYIWNCLATDTLGTSLAPSNFTLNIDLTPPVISSLTLNETYLCGNSSQIKVNCSTSDSLTGVSNVTINAKGPGEDKNYSASLVSGNNYSAIIPLNNTGSWNITCISKDYAGNEAKKNSSIKVYYTLPDLEVSSKDISFSNSNPYENQNVTISAVVHNNGCQNAGNFPTAFYIGDPSLGGRQIGKNITLSIPARSNATANIFWLAQIGPSNFFVSADINNTISEGNETNNKANKTLEVGAWQTFYGNVSSKKIVLSDSSYYNMTLWFNQSASTGVIFVTDENSVIHWSDLYALGRDVNNSPISNDFSDLDTLFNMSLFNDSIADRFTTNGNTPKETENFTVESRNVPYVPVINSTNNSNFVTGIMWDSYSDTDGQFDTSDKEKVVFATKINPGAIGKYGTYDYEITIPVELRNQSIGDNSQVYFYYELH